MTKKDMLFRVEGRANRAQYWGYGVLVPLLFMLIVGVMVAILLPLLDETTLSETILTTVAIVTGIIGFTIFVLVIWISIAVGVKRFHDMNQSGWLYALAFIPYLGTIVVIVIGIIQGTDGENQYGDVSTPVE